MITAVCLWCARVDRDKRTRRGSRRGDDASHCVGIRQHTLVMFIPLYFTISNNKYNIISITLQNLHLLIGCYCEIYDINVPTYLNEPRVYRE